MKINGKILLLSFLSFMLFSCTRDPLDADVSGIQVNAKARRFEHDLFKSFQGGQPPQLNQLRLQYGGFLDVFVHRIINIPEGSDSLIAEQLGMFVNDAEVNDIYRLADSAFNNMEDVESGLEGFLKHLLYHFPNRPLPEVVTYISAFNYAVITTDSVLGIGLDMFLGQDIAYYPRLGIPKYMFTKFRREYIVPSAIKAWFQSEYDISGVKNQFLDQMIYQGKLLYFSNAMAPGLNDTLISGYSQEQLDWCQKNESNIWSFFIENKLLFGTDPSQYAKFINEGPATSGFPKEAPGKIGAWTGWQIVKAYAEKNSELSLPELLQENDAQKILEKSGYKPKKQ